MGEDPAAGSPGRDGVVVALLVVGLAALLLWWPWETTDHASRPEPPGATIPAGPLPLTDADFTPGTRYEHQLLICRTDCSTAGDVVTVTVSFVAPSTEWHGRIDSGQGGATTHRAGDEGWAGLGWNPVFGWSGHQSCARASEDAVVPGRRVRPVDDADTLGPQVVVTEREDEWVSGRSATSLEVTVAPCPDAADDRWVMVTTGYGDRRPRARLPADSTPAFFHLVPLPEISADAHLAVLDLSNAATLTQSVERRQIFDSLQITVR